MGAARLHVPSSSALPVLLAVFSVFLVVVYSVAVECPLDEGSAVDFALEAQELGTASRLPEAIACYRLAVHLQPSFREAWVNLGVLLEQQSNASDSVAEAILAYQHALTSGPYAPALSNLGHIFSRQGRCDEALPYFERALQADTQYVSAWIGAGLCLSELGEAQAAIAAYQHALAADPHSLPALVNLAALLSDTGHRPAALDLLQQALALCSGAACAEPLVNTASVLEAMGNYSAAARLYEQALRWRPDLHLARASLLYVRRMICDWRTFEADTHAARLLARQDPPHLSPFAAMSQPLSAGELRRVAVGSVRGLLLRMRRPLDAGRWQAGVTSPPPPPLPLPPPHYQPHWLRVGFVSSDYGAHTMGYLFQTVFERLRAAGDTLVFAYSLKPDDGTVRMRRIAAAAHVFRDVSALGAVETAASIAADELDVLVDLNGHTGGNRMGLFASRPAPLQLLLGVGYPGTTGAPFIDYYAADRQIAPPDLARDGFTEALAYFPGTYQVNPHLEVMTAATSARPSRADVGLPANASVVLCAFHQLYKLTPAVFAVWMRALRHEPRAVLWLLRYPPDGEANLRATAAEWGVYPWQVHFTDRRPRPLYIADATLCDLFVDTWEVNAHSTATDMLWAGVPVLTTPGHPIASRIAASLLRALDDAELAAQLIAPDRAVYESRLRLWTQDPAPLGPLRDRIVRARDSGTATLFDTGRWVRSFRRMVRLMVDRQRAGTAPAPLIVRDDRIAPAGF